MARQKAYRFSTGAWLLASAAAPVTAMMIATVIIFALDSLPFIIKTAHASPETQKVLGFTSLWSELFGAFISLIRDILFLPIFGVLFGFLGACLILLPAFLLAERRPTARAFILAGAGAGLVHASSGIMLVFAAKDSSSVRLIFLAMGYLPYGLTPLARFASAVGAVVAGAVIGKLYWRLRS